MDLSTLGEWYRSSLLPRRPNAMPFKVFGWRKKKQCEEILSLYEYAWIITDWLNCSSLFGILNSLFYSAYGSLHSCTIRQTESKVCHTVDISQIPAQLWLNSIFVCLRGKTWNKRIYIQYKKKNNSHNSTCNKMIFKYISSWIKKNLLTQEIKSGTNRAHRCTQKIHTTTTTTTKNQCVLFQTFSTERGNANLFTLQRGDGW